MKPVWFVSLSISALLAVNPLMAADSPPTPKLQKADIPLLDLGSELGGPSTRSTSPAPKTYQPNNNLPSNPPSSYTADKVKQNTSSKMAEKPTMSEPNWSYSGKNGPKYWSEISADNQLCSMGKNQSPVDLRDNQALGTTGLAELEIRYRDVPLKTLNNGRTLQVNYPLGSYIKLGTKRYELLHYEFHTPSEHQKEGFNYPMEVQMVHRDGDHNFVVLSVLFQEGEENESLQVLLDHLPKEVGKETIHRGAELNPVMFVPANTDFYKYSGSLTKPPCQEGVYWMVFKQPIEASAEQIQQLNEMLGDNARPIQGVHARNILKSWAELNQQEPALYEFY